MKYTLLAPILLSSTAFAGAGQWKRQDPSPTTAAPAATTTYEFTICRDERDCLPSERCVFQTLNGAHNGYNGVCKPENYTYVTPSPTPLPPRPTTANNLCSSDNECRTDETCLTGNDYGEGGGPGGHCVSMQRDGPCSFNYNCYFTQYCDTGNGKCTNYRDCRSEFCPPPVGSRGESVTVFHLQMFETDSIVAFPNRRMLLIFEIPTLRLFVNSS